MALFLVQHGKALPKEIDPEQGLSAQGKADVQRIAAVAKGYGVKVARIAHSGKKRARQTAELFSEALRPEGGVGQMSGIDPLDNVAPVAEHLFPDAGLMLVGHLPFMERLAAYLVCGSGERPVFRFQNGGIVCLDRHLETGTWVIKWTLMPTIG